MNKIDFANTIAQQLEVYIKQARHCYSQNRKKMFCRVFGEVCALFGLLEEYCMDVANTYLDEYRELSDKYHSIKSIKEDEL